MEKKLVRPFLKWAGGKGQLIDEIEKFYPFNKKINKYAEPFVGGGAVFFDILNKFELKEIYISDTNSELINCYDIIKTHTEELIKILKKFQEDYIPKNQIERKEYYLEKRKRFNNLKINGDSNINIEKAALMIFLNRTCFNGLYRVNKKGEYNVPMGVYKNPLICDEENIRAIADKMKNVIIKYGDYKESYKFIDKNTFVYFDPPYRPLTETSNFTSYTENDFGDKEQIELGEYFKLLDKKGAKVLLSNSDPKNVNSNDNFFDEIYSDFNIIRIEAKRMINSKAENRGKIKEILVSNGGGKNC